LAYLGEKQELRRTIHLELKEARIRELTYEPRIEKLTYEPRIEKHAYGS
jgi:hypothetical protein